MIKTIPAAALRFPACARWCRADVCPRLFVSARSPDAPGAAAGAANAKFPFCWCPIAGAGLQFHPTRAVSTSRAVGAGMGTRTGPEPLLCPSALAGDMVAAPGQPNQRSLAWDALGTAGVTLGDRGLLSRCRCALGMCMSRTGLYPLLVMRVNHSTPSQVGWHSQWGAGGDICPSASWS